MVEKRAQEQKQAEEKKHGEEINFLKRTNQQLKGQLEGIISQKKQGKENYNGLLYEFSRHG